MYTTLQDSKLTTDYVLLMHHSNSYSLKDESSSKRSVDLAARKET